MVVTRPAPDHRVLMDGIEAMGLRALHQPLFSIEPVASRAQVTDALADADLAIVTSPAAARTLSELLPDAAHGLPFLAPGTGTAGLLRRAGLDARSPVPSGDSEALLALPELSDVQGRRVVVFGAPGGRELIQPRLRQRGATVNFVQLYRRQPLELTRSFLKLLESGIAPVVIVSSALALGRLHDLVHEPVRARLLEGVFILSSSRLERLALELGAVHCLRARSAASTDLLATLGAAGEGTTPSGLQTPDPVA